MGLGRPIPLWSGAPSFSGAGFNIAIRASVPAGQVLGIGAENAYSSTPLQFLYLYDTKTQSLTNLNSLVSSLTGRPPRNFQAFQSPNWQLSESISLLDDQGRTWCRRPEVVGDRTHNLLLIPEGLSSGPVATPEPSTWAVFATLIGGWMIRRRLGGRPRS